MAESRDPLKGRLTDFASAAQSTYQGRLFAHDALQGLRVIDLTWQRFDVVVMNPPFGLPAVNSKAFLRETYPEHWTDYYNVFIKRAMGLIKRTVSSVLSFQIGYSIPRNLLQLGTCCLLISK